MLTIEAHRLVIGGFCAKTIILSSQGVARKKQQGKKPSSTSLTKVFSSTTVSSISKGFVSLIVVLGLIVFQLSGDVESNPGPAYTIEKVISGSFHQGDTRFGTTAGIQCACNSLFALCFSQVKKVFRWNAPDLDYILTEGDILYKSLGTMDLLSAHELPRSVVMSNYNIPIDYLELETEIANLRTGELFLRRIISISAYYHETMLLLFIGRFTTAIMKQHGYFYLFDSHSRDKRGLSIVGGTSVLLKFRDLTEVEKYIQVFYLTEILKSSHIFSCNL